MATAIVRKSNKSSGRSREDLHVRMSDAPKSPETAPGEGGRYVYGILSSKDHMTFGKIGIGGAANWFTP